MQDPQKYLDTSPIQKYKAIAGFFFFLCIGIGMFAFVPEENTSPLIKILYYYSVYFCAGISFLFYFLFMFIKWNGVRRYHEYVKKEYFTEKTLTLKSLIYLLHIDENDIVRYGIDPKKNDFIYEDYLKIFKKRDKIEKKFRDLGIMGDRRI